VNGRAITRPTLCCRSAGVWRTPAPLVERRERHHVRVWRSGTPSRRSCTRSACRCADAPRRAAR
jgi:hypothetical protein